MDGIDQLWYRLLARLLACSEPAILNLGPVYKLGKELYISLFKAYLFLKLSIYFKKNILF